MEINIIYKGVEFQVEFDFQPEEPMVRYYSDGSGYPGCPAEATINEISYNEECFFDILEDKFDEIQGLILEKMGEEADNSRY